MISTYNQMWEEVKKLSLEELKAWYNTVSPCRGTSVDFFGVRVVDVDLAEALEFMINEIKA